MKMVKAKLEEVDGLGRLEFKFNPSEYSVQKSAQWDAPRRSMSTEGGAEPEFIGTEPRSVHMQIFFDDWEAAVGDVTKDVEKICMLTLCGLVPMNSGFAPASVLMLRRGASHCALFCTEYSLGLNLNSSLPRPPTSSSFAFTIFIACRCSYPRRNPLWASSSVSVAAWLAPMSSDGPFQRTGKTPSRFQVAIG